ncbi:3,4-dihydroxy-2-butanone-4-phosphate synthase [Nocardia sp. CDC186]|uniref:3,4-dihydroxy-2-butanone-4-phosphate synthase n=1 Tax=Nocardia implantans TaxID=3108168 RepID=A0ABU6ARW7_9NOCA|nr:MULTISPECIES: 3,4-dihydroxy-2-butanone-4-phosphate synthase [unclassified Nocardia]MBF6191590.1 3,4-dihydroxy-2-butanone-4-phosphate synthase [Nocardia beijingensis]MEA3528103.1 3,4-dihydroxy-2-butanone-4-phosphate synthase [Nocardia sp. CDC192]MEB3510145.1 3,4-dihydroxy-2-butanone-4-phosphate synthase [Nocardia sp. CDC186]
MTAAPRTTGRTRVAEATAALRAGRMILVLGETSDGCRGDLVMAAQRVTAEAVNAMASLGCGLIHVSMRAAALDALGIPPADPAATGPDRDLFRVSVRLAGAEADGVRASRRAQTVRALADPASTPSTFARPGHVFPLGCAAGGVLSVPACPEAAVDLAELAGMAPVGVLCEVCGADGEQAGRSQLLALGRDHGLPVVSIDDLVAYRKRELCRVRRRGVARIPLPMGEFRAVGFTDGLDRAHVAFVHGDPAADVAPLVRLHFECLAGDVFGSRRCRCRGALDRALDRIARDGSGVLVYIRARTTAVRDTLRACRADGESGSAEAQRHSDLQSAFDILDALAVREIRLLCDAGEAAVEPERARIVARIPLTHSARHPDAETLVTPRAGDRIGSLP